MSPALYRDCTKIEADQTININESLHSQASHTQKCPQKYVLGQNMYLTCRAVQTVWYAKQKPMTKR